MKLTPKQNEVIEQYKYLESKYGKGNVGECDLLFIKQVKKNVYPFMIIRLMEELLIHWIEIIY